MSTETLYDCMIGVATLIGIGLHNATLFGNNLESYNWGLITILVTLEIAWVSHKLIEFGIATPSPSPHADNGFHKNLRLGLRVLIGTIGGLAVPGLWRFHFDDIGMVARVGLGFLGIAGLVWFASKRPPSTLANAALPYLLELMLAVFVIAFAPRFLPAHPRIRFDELTCFVSGTVISMNIATLLALQVCSCVDLKRCRLTLHAHAACSLSSDLPFIASCLHLRLA